jgi:SAM-dependent methyltransferase
MNEKRYSAKSLLSEYNPDRLRVIRSLLPVTGKLLEVGCWDGTTLKFYRDKFKGDAYGIDISRHILKMSAPFYKQVKVCDLNKDRIPFPDGFFDAVVCGEVIEHIYDTDRLVRELRRVTAPQGAVIISTPNLGSFINRWLLLFGLQPLGTEVSPHPNNYGNMFRKKLDPAGHIRNFTFGAFCDIMQANGFEVIRAFGVAMTRQPLSQFIENLTGLLFPALGSDMVLQCRRKEQ